MEDAMDLNCLERERVCVCVCVYPGASSSFVRSFAALHYSL